MENEIVNNVENKPTYNLADLREQINNESLIKEFILLPDKQRLMAYYQCIYPEIKNRELSEIFGCTINNVSALKAKKRVREFVKNFQLEKIKSIPAKVKDNFVKALDVLDLNMESEDEKIKQSAAIESIKIYDKYYTALSDVNKLKKMSQEIPKEITKVVNKEKDDIKPVGL